MVAFRPDSFGLWYYKVNKMWSVIILGPKIFGLWRSAVVCGVQADRLGLLPPENFWNSICDLVHFDGIWWQLFAGRQ